MHVIPPEDLYDRQYCFMLFSERQKLAEDTDMKPHLAMVKMSKYLKPTCLDSSNPKSEDFSKETWLEPCKINFLHTTLMSVPVNKYVLFSQVSCKVALISAN